MLPHKIQLLGLKRCYSRCQDNLNFEVRNTSTATDNFSKSPVTSKSFGQATTLNRSLSCRRFSCEKKCAKVDTKSKLMTKLELGKAKVVDKITVVGAGAVGMACVSAILGRRLTKSLCIMDIREEFVRAEALDYLHGSVFNDCPDVTSCADGSKAKGSKYIVFTCGARPKPGQSRLEVAQTTADILTATVPSLVKGSPDATYIVVSNPADVMTYVVQKLSNLPKERCFSAGTNLDTGRFRYFIAKRLGVSPKAVYGFAIGEHGENLVPLWSTVTVGGTPLVKLNPDIGTDKDPEKWAEVVKQTVNAAYDLIKIKGYTSWAIGLSVANIIASMKENSGCILPLGTICEGINGVCTPVVMSMPCMVNTDGITHIVNLQLTECEAALIKKTEKILGEQQNKIKIKKKCGK